MSYILKVLKEFKSATFNLSIILYNVLGYFSCKNVESLNVADYSIIN